MSPGPAAGAAPLLQAQGLHAWYGASHVLHGVDIRIADRITVMVNGAVLASDLPAAVRANPDVQKAYLGAHE